MFRFTTVCVILLASTGCINNTKTSDIVQQEQQENILAEGTAQVGMPAIKNFRERKILKDILELRDQSGLVTFTYLENQVPHREPGHTALGGKLTFFGQTVGYGIPYATQFTNPQKIVRFVDPYIPNSSHVIQQADPNGLFSPAAAEGTWVLMLDPKSKQAKPVYIESRIVVSPFELKLD